MKKVADKSIYYRLDFNKNLVFTLDDFSKRAKLQGWSHSEILQVVKQVYENEKSAKSILMMYCR